MAAELHFPDGFLWGAATSSHQVEGGLTNDWTEWEKLGKIAGGERSGAACDFWNRYREDIDLIARLGHTAHRFSIEWSRVEPTPGVWDESAIARYRDMVSLLKAKGIEPVVVLWHFTNPLWFRDAGGWESGRSVSAFSRYAEKMAQSLPEVAFWMTVNEPNVYSMLGYFFGHWPPEHKNPVRTYRVFSHLAAAHRAAYSVIKRTIPHASVGSALNASLFEPSDPKRLFDRWATSFTDSWYNHLWYSKTIDAHDFLGINHYHHQLVKGGVPWRPIVLAPQGEPRTDFAWQIYPEAMYRVLKDMARYHKPIYVTENGLADAKDQWRTAFIRDYLVSVHRAISEGVDVRGYLHWSLLDNFEWREGFSKRFGLVAVDFSTQQRTVRPSGVWYAEVCIHNTLIV